MATSLESLLRTMHSAPHFGDAFGLVDGEMDSYLARMEAVGEYFVDGMRRLVAKALPDWDESERNAEFVDGAVRWAAFSPGLAADMTSNVRRLGDMAVLTGLTAVVNWTLDRGDQAMSLAVGRFPFNGLPLADRFRRHMPPVPPELKPAVRARSSVLWAIGRKLGAVAHPGDLSTLYRIVGKDLVNDGKRIHELSVLYSKAEDGDVFLEANAEETSRLMIDTGAIQSVVAPLYSMLRRGDKALPPLKEVYGSEYAARLLKLGNAIIRVQDDAGDMARDQDPKKFSINLFNQPSAPLIRAFCGHVGLGPDATEQMVSAFPNADTPEKRRKKDSHII